MKTPTAKSSDRDPQSLRRSAGSALGVAALLLLIGCAEGSGVRGAGSAHLVSAGEGIARRECGGCHGLDERLASPLPDAPAFPVLRARLSRTAMGVIVAERMSDIHPRMPQLRLDGDQVTEFLDYWDRLQPASGDVG